MDNNQIIVVDVGNTYVKIGYFINSKLANFERVTWTDFSEESSIQKKLTNLKGIFSSVLSFGQNQLIKSLYPHLIAFDLKLKLPLKLDYKTIDTLGKDRLCNAVAAWNMNPTRNSLIIDVGTCIKFDFVSKNSVYEGGAISPGIKLRYKSLNDYTANLPLVNELDKVDLIGKSTIESIHSGVMNGINAEIQYLIQEYEKKYDSLTIFVTGGDAKYFDIATKNNIFANENYTLNGLYQIYLFNA